MGNASRPAPTQELTRPNPPCPTTVTAALRPQGELPPLADIGTRPNTTRPLPREGYQASKKRTTKKKAAEQDGFPAGKQGRDQFPRHEFLPLKEVNQRAAPKELPASTALSPRREHPANLSCLQDFRQLRQKSFCPKRNAARFPRAPVALAASAGA